MRWILLIASIAILLSLLGVGCLVYSMQFPVYTDPDAPARLSGELESLPREARFEAWHSQLHAYETPHKRLSDLGRGLLSAGMGLLASLSCWALYHRFALMRNLAIVFVLWLCLWIVRIPFTLWFHRIRQERFDYPAWADSIAIPIMVESMAWIVGAVVSLAILSLLRIRHPLPEAIRLHKPTSYYGWARAVFIVCWLLFLCFCVVVSVPAGDEGMVFTCIMAGLILLAFLFAPEVVTAETSVDGRT